MATIIEGSEHTTPKAIDLFSGNKFLCEHNYSLNYNAGLSLESKQESVNMMSLRIPLTKVFCLLVVFLYCVWFSLEWRWHHLFPAALEWGKSPLCHFQVCLMDAWVMWVTLILFQVCTCSCVIEVTQYLPVQLSFLKPASGPGQITRVFYVLSQLWPLSPALHDYVRLFNFWLTVE